MRPYFWLSQKQGAMLGYAGVFSRIDLCRGHYEKAGLGADYTDRFIR